MIFKDRVRKEPYKRKITFADGHSEEVTIEEVDGNVTQNGTPLNSTNMNKLMQYKNNFVCNSAEELKEIGNSFAYGTFLGVITPRRKF